jgi:hypothetical protein
MEPCCFRVARFFAFSCTTGIAFRLATRQSGALLFRVSNGTFLAQTRIRMLSNARDQKNQSDATARQ